MSSLVITEVVKASEGLEINHVVTLRLGAHSPCSVITKNHMVSRVKLLSAQVTDTTGRDTAATRVECRPTV